MICRVGLAFLLSFCFSQVESAPSIDQFEQKIGDSVITTRVDTELAKNGDFNPLKLHVSTKKGIVTLRGTVRNKKMFVGVLRLVKATKGVRGVEVDQLHIKQVNTAVTDAYITAKVEAAVLKAKVFDDESIPLVGIKAQTENGKVTLTGYVKKKQSISFIVKRIASIHGVKAVNTKLKVVQKEGDRAHVL